ncbi:MAG: hypothetical protein BJ554DRAFT_2429, partial [Olpidium bornovanus]
LCSRFCPPLSSALNAPEHTPPVRREAHRPPAGRQAISPLLRISSPHRLSSLPPLSPDRASALHPRVVSVATRCCVSKEKRATSAQLTPPANHQRTARHRTAGAATTPQDCLVDVCTHYDRRLHPGTPLPPHLYMEHIRHLLPLATRARHDTAPGEHVDGRSVGGVEASAHRGSVTQRRGTATQLLVAYVDRAHEVGAITAARDPSAPPLGRAPFLRDVVTGRGSWGVSHTRVPTESRPGHVAIIAGLYEDVSAVTKGWLSCNVHINSGCGLAPLIVACVGWKMNPVNFDSVFNQSRHTWSFGSPDILPMFSHGASDPSRVETIGRALVSAVDRIRPSLPSPGKRSRVFRTDLIILKNLTIHTVFAMSVFRITTKDASRLDSWVFDKFAELFANATANSALSELLREEKVIFFLHLLGLDSAGHAHRPHSAEYLDNVRSVDAGIRGVTELMAKFYGDDRTAF